MAMLSHAESRRLYSWWWDSHISPKNSKWLQENLTDMDVKVKTMIKLIEEDADSFRKRAEMYYRKRPELMKLVEEFYRAYRALAERYDHATGALRQAHRTMAEAFPDQIPLIFADDPPPLAPLSDPEPSTSEALDTSSQATASKSNREEKSTTTCYEGSWKSTTGEEFASGWARNGSPPQNAEGKSSVEKFQQEIQKLLGEIENLKNQISIETARADQAGAEAGTLKGTVTKLESEHKLALENISSLQSDLAKVNDELLAEAEKSRSFEDRCHQLEKENQSLQLEMGMLQLELGMIKETAKKKEEELVMKQAETEKLIVSINEEHEKTMQVEKSKASLCEQIDSLKEQMRSSALKMKTLQDEVSLLEQSNRMLEDEVGLHVVEKKYLHQEIFSIKEDKKALEQRHSELTEQIGAVSSNVDSLQTMVKELRDGNLELKELCQKHENERVSHLESLRFLEKITEQNAALESSLSSANAELEELREKVKTLEELCEALEGKITMHVSEKAVLVSQIDVISRNMETLSVKNTFLENSLSDVNVELESLRSKLSVLEESCQSLRGQNTSLLDEKSTLLIQVESVSQSLESLETRYAELEEKNLNLENERDHILHQVRELQDSLRAQEEEYQTLALTSKSQLDALEDQIAILQERGRQRENELEEEHQKIVNARVEIFVLQEILRDMKESNVLLSEKSRRQDNLISQLKQGFHQVMRALSLSKECSSPDDSHLDAILLEIQELKALILDVQDENQQLILEKSVIFTILKQNGLSLAALQSEKSVLERESKSKSEEFLALQSKEQQILQLNEQLQEDLRACSEREESLATEMGILCKRLSDLQEDHSTLQSDILKLKGEKEVFSTKVDNLLMETDTLQEHNNSLIAENVNLEQEITSLTEKLGAAEIENIILKESLMSLAECKRGLLILEDEVRAARDKCQELDMHIEIGKNLLIQKDMELLQENHKFESVQAENKELREKIEGLMLEIDQAKAKREELEKNNLILVNNETVLHQQVGELLEEVEGLKLREKHLAAELEQRTQELKLCEAEIETLLSDVYVATVKAETFEEKMLELLVTCESLDMAAMIQRYGYEEALEEKLNVLHGENRSLKDKVSAYLPVILSMGDFVTSLEKRIQNHGLSNNQEKQDDGNLQHEKSNEERKEGQCDLSSPGSIELQKLQAKLNALEERVINILNDLEHERHSYKPTPQSEITFEHEELGSKEKPEQAMKDIQLDHVLSSSHYERGSSSRAPSACSSDETLDGSNKMEKPSPQKNLSIDKLEMPSKTESRRGITDMLSSDAQRISALQTGAQELKKTIESSDLSDTPTSLELKRVKAQLKEAEAAISQLVDTNAKLMRKTGKTEIGNSSERKICERVRRGSEKISRLELELQRIEYVWLKLKEEDDYRRARAAQRRTRVLLRDYLYGRREKSPSRKKAAHCCAWVRPAVRGDDSE